MINNAGSKTLSSRTTPSEQWSIARYVLAALCFLTIILRYSPYRLPAIASTTQDDDPYAYVFYATQGPYACSALVNAVHLQTTLNTTHAIYLLATKDLSNDYIKLFRQHGINVIISSPPPLSGSNGYYNGALLKMMAFGIYNYAPHLKRVIILDSDQLVLRNLDHLFHLPSVPLAAPRAYWIEGKGPGEHPPTSALMVIEQSPKTWALVEHGLRTIRAYEYDMDLMYDLFADTLLMLPGYYCTLNSHWENWDLPTWYTGHGGGPDAIPDYERAFRDSDDNLIDLWERTAVVHYTAIGKPWNSLLVTSPDKIPKDAHWLLRRQFEMWKEGVAGGKPTEHSTATGARGPVYGADQICLGTIDSGYSLVGMEPGSPRPGYGAPPIWPDEFDPTVVEKKEDVADPNVAVEVVYATVMVGAETVSSTAAVGLDSPEVTAQPESKAMDLA